MNPEKPDLDSSDELNDIGDLNVERLLGNAYKPETPEPEFVSRVESSMISAARERAEARAVERPQVTIARRPAYQWRTLAWSAVAATILVGVGFIVGRQMGRPAGEGLAMRPVDSGANHDSFFKQPVPPVVTDSRFLAYQHAPQESRGDVLVGDRGLTPRPRPLAPSTELLAIGSELRTESGQRRRVELADHSVLFLNENTHVAVTAERQLALNSGEIYVEVSPLLATPDSETDANEGNEGDTKDHPGKFVVKTVGREITALGTKFAVRAESDKADVRVTQGKVQVSDVAQPIIAGQQFVVLKTINEVRPDKSASVVSPLPRASHVLDWTSDLVAAAESPLVPASEHAGGSIVARDPNGQEARLSLRKYHVDVHIEDGFARTTIDQTYFNHTSWRLEGTFHFPLPPDASLSRLAMYVDGKLMEGGMAERNYAREVFEKIVRTQKDPALLEWVVGSTFKMRVFPLEARQEKRIVLSYTQRLETLYGNSKYRFPAGHSLDSVRDWSFHARIKRGAELTWICDSHDLKDSKDGKDLVLNASGKEVKLDRDVVLRLTDRQQPLTTHHSQITSSSHDGYRYVMLRLRPDLPTKAHRQRRDWVFLFESSGDRDPVLARVQVDVIKGLLQNAEHDDTFAILTAGTQVRAFKSESVAATPENVKAAVDYLDGVHLVGALDLGQALAAADPFVKSGKNAYLVHIGSGMPVLGERAEDKLLKRIPASARYVGVGVGKRWSRQFMKTAASRTGGYFTQINPDEPVAWRAFDLYSTLNTPRLLNAAVVDHAERIPFLVYNDSIAHGEKLCAIARLDANEPLPDKITVSGTLDGEPFRRVIPVENVADNADYLPRTWAKLRIDQLLADDAAKHKDEIISLSKAMYVMSPFTSLLVLENEQMYVQFNIDRGRKDHWAMYDCPPQIPVVHEPLPSQPAVTAAVPETEKASKRMSVREALSTIITRDPIRFFDRPGIASYYGFTQPHLQLLMCPDDNGDSFSDSPNMFLAAIRANRTQLVQFFHMIDYDGRWPNSGTWGTELDIPNLVQNSPLATNYRMMGDYDPNLWGNTSGYWYTPGKININTLHDSGLFSVLGRSHDPLPELTVFMAQTTTNHYELFESREASHHRLVRSLLPKGKSDIAFPNEPPLEYPDATWWEEMSRRGQLWQRVDLFMPSAAEARIHEKLRDPVSLEFVETPLSDVVDFLRDCSGLNIVLDKPALEEGGVTSDTSVSINVQNISMRSALRILLGQLNSTYRVKDDVLQVTSQLQAASDLAHRVYPVSDLVIPVRNRFVGPGSMDSHSTSVEHFLESARLLMRQGRFESAGTLAGRASEIDSNNPTASALRYKARVEQQLRLQRELEKRKEERVLESLHAVDRIAVPFGDDSPTTIKYPDARVWNDLTANRKRRLNQLLHSGPNQREPRISVAERNHGHRENSPADENGEDTDDLLSLAYSSETDWQSLLYERPRFTVDLRAFNDLLAYAPGMQTCLADVLAVLESESDLDVDRSIGRIDPAARELIEQARQTGWQVLSSPANRGRGPVKVEFDGTGRFSIEQTTGEGLGERLVSDGSSIWHLYSDLGVGVRRAINGFHRTSFARLIPWAVLPPEDLAQGADLVAVDHRTVAIVPHGAADARDSNGKPLAYMRMQLVFSDDGRLSERWLVEMPAGKTLLRETYSDDGAVRLFDADAKLLAERQYSLAPTPTPDLEPDTKQFVILPLPLRGGSFTAQIWAKAPNNRFESLSEVEAMVLIASGLGDNPATLRQIIGQRFFSHGDRRIGFYTLLMASGLRWDPEADQDLANGSHVLFDPVADHPNSTLARYIFLHQQQISKSGKFIEVDLADGSGQNFIENLAAFRDHNATRMAGKLSKGSIDSRAKERENALSFVRGSKSPLFAWAVLGTLLDRSGDHALCQAIADACERFKENPTLAYTSRYEAARATLRAGDWQKAQELFSQLHAETLTRGSIPPVDSEFALAFHRGGNWPKEWLSLWESAAQSVIDRGNRRAALALAWQCRQLGSPDLADQIFAKVLAGVTDDERPSLTLAAVDYLCVINQPGRADALFQSLLQDDRLNKSAWLWRAGASLAQSHGMTSRAVTCLDRALDLEYSQLPDDIPVESVQAAFGPLLSHYQQLADSIASLHSEPPADLVGRVIRAADRWRSLDPDVTAVCQAAARILQRIGLHDLAWEYLTTPWADRPGDSPQWVNLAETMRGQNEFELADRAYRSAFDTEPSNAQVLWDHAQMLEQVGRPKEARSLVRRLAEGEWSQQYEAIQSRAREQMKKLDNPANPEKP